MMRFFTVLFIGILFLSYVPIIAKENDRKGVVHAREKEKISNNSANHPGAVVPVALSITGLANPVVQVAPSQISDTLGENQPLHPTKI
jgi:hypothetical protein